MSYESLIKYRKSKNNSKDNGLDRLLASRGYTTDGDGNIVVDLTSVLGTNFGKVSRDAYKAIESGTLDSYKPKDYEKDVISKFRNYLGTPLSSPSGVEFGNVSYDAYNAIINDKLDSYTPKNDAEKKIIDDFKTYAAVYSADAVSGGLKYNSELGQYGKGNINLYNRPQHKNADGSISTVRSATFEIDGKYVVLPTVVFDGRSGRETSKILSDEEAIEHYHKTGEYLGKFDTLYEADLYAQKLHLAQDFYYGSKYKTTKNGKKTEFSNFTPGLVVESGYDDLTYDVINKNEDATGIQSANDIAINATIAGVDKGFLQTMTDDEVAIFNYIYSTQGADKAYEFINNISADLNYRQRVKTEKYWADEAAKSPVKTSAFSVLISPYKMASYVGQVADYVDDGHIDQNAGYNKYVHIPNAIRNEVSTQIANSGKWGTVGSYTYNIGMSMADSLYNTAISGGQQWLSLAIMGTGAAADTTVAAKDRGLSDDQAFWLGTIAGAGEIVSEKMSFGAVMDADLFTQSARKYFVKSATVGGLEEVVADGINFAADTIIAGDKSLWSQSIKSYMQQGKTKSEAVGLTLGNKLLETGLSFVGGAFSTGIMTLGGTVYNTERIKTIGSQYNNDADVASVIEKGLNQPTNSAAYQNAVKLQDKMKSGNITNFEIGQQVLLNEGATATDKTDSKVSKAKKLIKKFSSYIHRSDAKKSDVDTSDTIVDTDAPVPTEIDSASVIPVGTMLKNTKTGNIVKVISSDATNTVLEVTDSNGNIGQRTLETETLNKGMTNGQIVVVGDESASSETAIAENATTTTEASPTNSETKTISLTRAGDFYEVYGNFALALADDLDMETTRKVVNGVETDVLEIPVGFADDWANAMAEDGYTVNFSDKPSIMPKNESVAEETETTDETTSSEEKTDTVQKMDAVISAMEETLTDKAKEDLQNGQVKENYDRIADSIIKRYQAEGSLKAFALFFTDGGKKVESAIKDLLGETTTESSKETNVSESRVLNNEPESDMIESTTENTSEEREENGNENERSEGTVEGRTVHNDGNVERTDGERTGRGGERVSGKTGNAQKTETERTIRKKIATTTFDEVKREYYTPEMKALEQGTYDKYGVVVKYFYGNCIDDRGAKGRAFYYNGVLYIQADAKTSMESRIDHEITHHFGKTNAMTKFRNAVKAKMPKAEYDSWYAEIKEAYGDVLVRYLSKELKNSNYTLTDAELQQLMDEYIEEEMLANLNGEQVPFATEYRAEIETFRKEIENYNTKNTKSKAKSESKSRNIPAEYSESIDAGGDARYSLGDVKFSEKPFDEQVDSVLSGEDTVSTHLRVSEHTPKLLLDLGLNDKPILITSVHTKTALGHKVRNKNTHYISTEVFKKLPQLVESPAIVMESTKKGSIVMFVNALDENNNPVVCSIKIDGKGNYNNVEVEANVVTSVYGKDTNPTGFIEKAVEDNRVLYWNKKMSQELFDTPGLQLPDNINTLDSNVIIRQISDNVNTKIPNTDSNGADPDTRYDISEEQDAEYMKAVESGDMETAQRMVDEAAKANGYNIRAYHGTSRADRVGNVFLPERATSGPMAFFTDNKDIAEGYSKAKRDTSMAYDPDYDSYETQFRIKTKNGDIPLYRAWGYLPFDARNRVTQKAQQLREDWDGDNEFILDPDNREANGGFQWQLKEARGNTLLALNEQWLNSGTLFNEESRFLEVLEMAGVMDEFKKIGLDSIYFKDPNARQEKVYDTYLRITKPFDTSLADNSFVDGLIAWYEEQDESKYSKVSMESDLWDKNGIDAYDFADRVRSDIERGTFHAWTSIPDSVTDYLKSLDYDGIKDLGGKNSDVGHTVWIPFSSEQIKSAEPVTYDDDGNVIPLSKRFNKDNNDIRYDLGNGNKLDTQKKIEKMAKEITSHEEFIELTKQNTQEFVDKVKENKNLQKRLKNAKRQMLVNPNPVVNETMAGRVTKDILTEMESTLKAKDLQDDVVSIYNEHAQAIKKSGGVKSKVEEANDTMVRRFTELAVDIADNAETFVESEMYTFLKAYVKETRIKVPDYAKEEADFSEFRKSHMGTFNLTNDGLDIDIAYAELCDMFPGLFDSEVSSPADQLNAIAEKLDDLKPYAYNPHSGYMNEAIDHIVNRFVSEADGITAAPKTKAQKMAEKSKADKEEALYKEKESWARKMDREKAKSEKNIQALQKKINDAKYVQYWEKRLGKEEKAEAVQKVRDNQKKAVLKSKIRNIVADMKKHLDKTEKNGGYPKELVKAAADVCSVIDFRTGRTNKDGTPTKTTLKLDALQAQYNALKISENYDFQTEYSEDISQRITQLLKDVENKRVVDLTLDELSRLKDILSEIHHGLSIASQQIGKDNAKANYEIFTEIVNDLDQIDVTNWKHTILKGESWVINPNRIFEMIANYNKDSAFWKLYEGILQGERDRKKFTMDANMPFDELTSGGANEVAFYDFRTKEYKTGIKYVDGTEVEIPKSIICELVMLWERTDGKKHLASGGMKIPNMKKFNKGKTRDAMDRGKLTRPITQADITRLRGMLDSYDKAWINRAYYLFNKVGKDAINETSMQLLGREIAKAKNYIRAYVDSDFVRQEIDKKNDNITLEGHGSLKETTPDAKNPVVLRGLHENVYDHIDFVAKYSNLAIPIRNFNKVYKLSDVGDNGHRSIKSMLGKKFGSAIRNDVIVKTINELQYPRPKEISAFQKVRGNWLNVTFFANVKSMFKQTTSYWTASSILDETSLLAGLKNYIGHGKQTKDEIAKYSGTLYGRSQGLSTTELGDRANRKRLAGASSNVTKAVNKYAPWLRNVPEGIRPENWLQSMDVNTSAALWEACKVEVSKTMDKSDEKYMQTVTDLWERVIEETQSNYDLLHRPEILKSEGLKTLSMFQNDNLQQTGILKSAYSNLRVKQKAYESNSSEANKKALDEAIKRMGKAVRARVYSSLWMAMVSVLGDALLRKFKPYIDDEEKEITASSVLEQMRLTMCEDMLGVFVPIAGDLLKRAKDTVMNGYDFMNEPSLDVIDGFLKTSANIAKEFYKEDGDVWKAISGGLRDISNMTGIPIKNVYDLYKSVKGYIGDIKVGEFAHDLEDYTTGNKSFYSHGDLASCISSGDLEKEQKILDYYSANEKEISKGSLTKEIKPAYVQMYVDSPEKASELKRKLVLEYDYSGDSIDEWMVDEYLKHIVSDPEYAVEIKNAVQQNANISYESVYKTIRSYYKGVYKDGDEAEIKALRSALSKDAWITEDYISQWELEADAETEKARLKQEAEKEKYR